MSDPLLQLDLDVAEKMGAAFDMAWAALCASGQRLSAQQACDARIRLARAILDRVQRGERDLARLSRHALASLKSPAPNAEKLAPQL